MSEILLDLVHAVRLDELMGDPHECGGCAAPHVAPPGS